MADSKATKVIIRLSDQEGIIRCKTDKTFSQVVEQVAKRLKMDPENVLNHYEGHWMDEDDKCWVGDEDSYTEGIDFAEGNKFELFFTRTGVNEESKQNDSDSGTNKELLQEF